MDLDTFLVAAFPLLINLVIAVIGAIFLWLIIRSAALSALRKADAERQARAPMHTTPITPTIGR